MKDETLEKIANKIPKSFKNNKIYQKISKSHKEEIKKKVDGNYDAYKNKIKEMKDIEKGKRVFIIGTGPSIDKTNLDLLKNEIVFGVNALHNAMKDFSCKYYAISDVNVWNNHKEEVKLLDTTLFLLSEVVEDVGFFVPYGDVKKTVSVIEKALISNKGKEARKRAIEVFSTTHREQELKKVIDKVWGEIHRSAKIRNSE
jgi:hypothetical protein